MFKKKRAQSALEFAIMLGTLSFIFIVFFGIIQNNQAEKNKEKEKVIVQNLALDVVDEINLAAGASEGYQRFFEVPDNILGYEYEINITDRVLYIITEQAETSYRVYPVIGNITKGQNLIKKENGTVFLN